MAMYQLTGSSADWEIQYFRKKASTAFTPNLPVSRTSADETIEPTVAATTTVTGIGLQQITSADADYASETLIAVAIPKTDGAQFESDTSADIAVTDIGEFMDLTNAGLVDPAASTTDIVILKSVISARRGVFVFNSAKVRV